MTGQLHISDGRKVEVRDGLVLGRIAGCDIVIDDTKASRRHARILSSGGVVEVEDLGSSNGTLLNGKPVQKRVLRDGDVIQIGATSLTFREVSAARVVEVAVDDVDLFGDDEPSEKGADAEVERRAPVEAPVTPAARATPVTPSPLPPAPPPSPPRGGMVEFADEIVEVKKAAPAARAGQASGKSSASGEPVMAQKQRVLQFSQTKERGALGDDLAQMNNGVRAAIVVGVILVALGLAYVAMQLAS